MNRAFLLVSSLLVSAEIQNGLLSYYTTMSDVDIISGTYKDKVLEKLQICRFQPPHSGLTTVIWETLSNV